MTRRGEGYKKYFYSGKENEYKDNFWSLYLEKIIKTTGLLLKFKLYVENKEVWGEELRYKVTL